jgi:predicted nucleotide-binding protein (sugar kinase/HSP70/actin superfamily)
MAPMSEWVLYTNYTFKRRLQRERRIIDLGRTTLIDIFQNRIEHQLMEEASRRIPLEPEQPMDRVIDLARPYLDPSFVGEAILSIGKAIEYYQRGAQGIVNAMPLTCMPGTIVTAISRKVRRDCHDLPWLNMAYEGLQGGHDLTRLEAFLYQAARFHPCRQRPLPRGASTCQKKAQASA